MILHIVFTMSWILKTVYKTVYCILRLHRKEGRSNTRSDTYVMQEQYSYVLYARSEGTYIPFGSTDVMRDKIVP